MKNSNDNMERARLRLKRLRKLTERIKIEEMDYYERFGDDNLKLVPLKYSKSETERFFNNRRSSRIMNPALIKFPVYKYFIEKGTGKLDEHALVDYTLFYKSFKMLLSIHFKDKDFVTIISNRNERYLSENRYIFDAFAGKKRGKLTYAENEDELIAEYSINKSKAIRKGIVEVSNKYSYLDQLIYLGSPIGGENVLLLGDEFGFDDAIGNLLVNLKPRTILNVLSNDKYTWFDNVD